MEQSNFTGLRTFNTAKKYAEEILFPKMDYFQKYQRQAEFGGATLEEALEVSKEIRDIQRFNGLKAMNDVLYDLLLNISSTVRLKKNNFEISLLNRMLMNCKKIKTLFNNEKENFFILAYSHSGEIEKLNWEYFNSIKEHIEKMYINCEILMTKNKLLFAETRDEFLDDKTIIENIKEEYIDG